jgi:hypothetical protein
MAAAYDYSVRIRFAFVALVLALGFAPAAGAAPFRATLTAPTHAPKTNAKWPYVVRATDLRGRSIRATITTQIVDPFGGAHPVEFGDTTKLVVRYPFTGVFRDFIRFPTESKGFGLTVRVIVRAKSSKIVLTYLVKPA